MRVTKIGGITLKYKLYKTSKETPNTVEAQTFTTLSGTKVVFAREIITPEFTIESKANGWIHDDTRDQLLTLFNNIGTEFVVEYDDGSTENCIFDYSNPPVFTPLFEGSCWSTATLNLIKVNP